MAQPHPWHHCLCGRVEEPLRQRRPRGEHGSVEGSGIAVTRGSEVSHSASPWTPVGHQDCSRSRNMPDERPKSLSHGVDILSGLRRPASHCLHPPVPPGLPLLSWEVEATITQTPSLKPGLGHHRQRGLPSGTQLPSGR